CPAYVAVSARDLAPRGRAFMLPGGRAHAVCGYRSSIPGAASPAGGGRGPPCGEGRIPEPARRARAMVAGVLGPLVRVLA
ncbi:MAG: hypothetical protein AMXMBFR13_11500, partial [Phycisphaerae bacterium]